MEITEVRVKLMDDPDDRLQAFCSITIDDSFVVRDLKIIDGSSGPFVAMPSRKLTSHCKKCRAKNHLRANFCNNCGTKQHHEQASRDHTGRVKLYADIAHPINSECREEIQQRVIEEFQNELEMSDDPNYVSRYDEGYDHEEEKQKSSDGERPNEVGSNEASSSSTPISAPAPTPTSDSSESRTRIEPQQEPTGPHQSRVEEEKQSVSKSAQEKLGDADTDGASFGAGIFD